MPQNLNTRTPKEYAALVAEVEAKLPVPLRDQDGVTRIVHHTHVEARLAAGWTR